MPMNYVKKQASANIGMKFLAQKGKIINLVCYIMTVLLAAILG